ncbi:ABC-type polysaccharide/polyol phosphate export system, permease component [Rubidibacter lacunae KORDI 51-2]|uniref:Transport permease protein n=1 Tax=Rubidibacter lacunae KORDI 51-2 TaxID=582515 RepID=U5DJK6_9CHRO|nr:ABC transporter permease [Rubidibacter lacunae]ERN41876.1 ABC-type polysaccharide/polyol phosphate export system, permease component [Rubidibacter lacunae KORDI 51-2]
MNVSAPKNLKWSQFRHYRELMGTLVERNLKGRYRGSSLGIFWSLLNPMIMAGIYTAVLGNAFAEHFDNSIINYILAAFTGLAIFHFFSAATSQALNSVVSNGGLLNKIYLPVSVFPSAAIAANIFQFSVATLPLFAIVTIWRSQSIVNVFALIFPVIALILVSSGVGYFLSATFVFFRDTPHLYQVTIYALRIATPVFYPVEIVPERLRPFIVLNPLSQVIESVRQITLSGDPPDLNLILGTVLSSLVVAILGWIWFGRLRPHFMDLL